MDQFTLDGYIGWQPAGAPTAEVINFVDNIFYTSVESYEITSSSSGTVNLDSSSRVVTAIYMEVYDKSVTIGGTISGGASLTWVGAGAPADSISSGNPDQDLIGRFFYTFPVDDINNAPNGPITSLSITPATNAVAKIWVFFR